MNRYFYNMDVHFKNGRVLKLGVETVAGLATAPEVQMLYATQVFPTATKILVVPVAAKPSARGSTANKLSRFATEHEKNVEERLRRMQGDLKNLPESVPPGRRQGVHFTHETPMPSEILALLNDDLDQAARLATPVVDGSMEPTDSAQMHALYGIRPPDPDLVPPVNPDETEDPGVGEESKVVTGRRAHSERHAKKPDPPAPPPDVPTFDKEG